MAEPYGRYRVKIFNVLPGNHAYTIESSDLVQIRKWAKNTRKHYRNNTITIQRIEKGTWQDWQLIL